MANAVDAVDLIFMQPFIFLKEKNQSKKAVLSKSVIFEVHSLFTGKQWMKGVSN